jgi:hypothetical protein
MCVSGGGPASAHTERPCCLCRADYRTNVRVVKRVTGWPTSARWDLADRFQDGVRIASISGFPLSRSAFGQAGFTRGYEEREIFTVNAKFHVSPFGCRATAHMWSRRPMEYSARPRRRQTAVVQSRAEAVSRKQFPVRPLFHDSSAVEDEDDVARRTVASRVAMGIDVLFAIRRVRASKISSSDCGSSAAEGLSRTRMGSIS